MATFYGSDSYCLTDLQWVSTQVTEPRVLIGQRIARRLQTPRGALALINGDPDFGFDVRTLVLGKLTTTLRVQAQSAIKSECLKDEEVLSASVSVEPTSGGSGLRITILLQASDGPFTLVLNVSDLTVDAILSLQGQV